MLYRQQTQASKGGTFCISLCRVAERLFLLTLFQDQLLSNVRYRKQKSGDIIKYDKLHIRGQHQEKA